LLQKVIASVLFAKSKAFAAFFDQELRPHKKLRLTGSCTKTFIGLFNNMGSKTRQTTLADE